MSFIFIVRHGHECPTCWRRRVVKTDRTCTHSDRQLSGLKDEQGWVTFYSQRCSRRCAP